jgi:hypothetical protein
VPIFIDRGAPPTLEHGMAAQAVAMIVAVIVTVASTSLTIYIDRPMAKERTKIRGKRQGVLSSGRKRVLVVLFIPSVERDGTSAIDQALWVDSALQMFGRVYGGATAFPKAKGIWRDDERGRTLVQDEADRRALLHDVPRHRG